MSLQNQRIDSTDEQTAQTLEREYYATCAGTPGFAGETTLREFLHSRGFSYKWLTQHGFSKDNE